MNGPAPSTTSFSRTLDPEQVARLSAALAPEPAAPAQPVDVVRLPEGVYRIAGPSGTFIVRLARDEAHLAALRREARVAAGMRERVTLALPDIRVLDDVAGCPACAAHHIIPGEPLTTELVAAMSPAARERLVADLARFFRETHAMPLYEACGWLSIPDDSARRTAALAAQFGKPIWFHAAELRARLAGRLKPEESVLFEQTAAQFAALGIDPDWMVFGHGDMHGFNVAMGRDALGPKLVGAFDLGNTGILDVHEDFFRLSLVGEDLLEQVLAAYLTQRLKGRGRPWSSSPGRRRTLSRERIAIYYRAFLFYLMAESGADALANLRALLQKHAQYEAQVNC